MLRQYTAASLHRSDPEPDIISTEVCTRPTGDDTALRYDTPSAQITSVEYGEELIEVGREGVDGLMGSGNGFGQDLTAGQVLALAESLDIEEIDWMNLVMGDIGAPLDR